MRKISKILSVFLTLAMVISIFPMSAITSNAATYSGKCGNSVTWSYDTSTYTLTISGVGDMYDYSYNNRPWESYGYSIKKVVINNGVTTIGDYAFDCCTSLTSVTIPDSVTTIGKGAFSYCSSLASVTIPNSVTTIGVYTFRNCTSLTSVTIGDSVTTIGDYAFSDCDSLASITIPDSVTTIGYEAFYCCTSLTSITIPDSVTIIGNYAFYDCISLTSVTIGNSVTTIGDDAFSSCDSLKSIIVDSDNQYYSNDEYGVLFNKDKTTIIQYPIGNTRTSYTIPDSVTTIGKWVFFLCESLTSVTIGDSVTTIGDYAFYYCDNLTSITIPDSVTTIGVGAFYDCNSLTDVYYGGTEEQWNKISIENNNDPLLNATIHFAKVSNPSGTCGENVTWELDLTTGTLTISGTGAMYDYGFNNRPWENYKYEIKTVVINNGVTTIGDDVFSRCTSLTSVTIPDSVTTIGDNAFQCCYALTSITIPDSVTTIGNYAFSACPILTSITIPDSVTTIGDSVFSNCLSLTSITIPDSVTTIGDWAFNSCNSLTDVYYNGTEEQWNKISIGSYNDDLLDANIHFANPSGTCGENVTWEFDPTTGTLTISGTGAMDDYEDYGDNRPWGKYKNSIKTVVINNGVTTIGDWAFYDCDNLTSVTISNSVTTIDECAFYDCYRVTSVTIPDSVTTIGDRAFEYCSNLRSVAIGDSVTTIGDRAFNDCGRLESITIPNSVTTIGDDTFYYCTSLTSVVIGNSVTTIGDGAFTDCMSLTSITIPDSVTTIRSSFIGCTSLKDVYYGGTEEQWNMIFIGSYNEYLLNATIHFAKVSNPSGTCGENVTWEFDPSTGTLTISGTGAIDDYAESNVWYEFCDDIKNVIINEGITKIGCYAFYYCDSLESVTLPDTLTTIDEGAFEACYELKNITIPAKVTTIGPNALKSTGIESIVIPYGVTKISNKMFESCLNLASVTIPNSVTSIGEDAFIGCMSLSSVTIPNSVTTIGNYAFHYTGLTSITIPNSITSFGYGVFSNCPYLSEAIISDGLTSFGEETFCGCQSLKKVTIPDSVTSIEWYAFYNCWALSNVTIPNSVTTIEEGAFGFCDSLTDVYYLGTEEEWNNIYIDNDNEENIPLLRANIHYNYIDPNRFTGIKGNYFYKNGVMQKAYQLVEFEGNYYFINNGNEIARNQKIYLSQRFVEGTDLVVGNYDFDADGKLVMKNGPDGDFFYRDGIQLKAYQLVEFEGDYYFINDGNKLAKNTRIYLSQKFVDGTSLAVGYYEFGADGKMAPMNGPIGDYFYKDGVQLKAYQLVEFEGNFYFVNDSHKLAKNKRIYLTERFTNGFTYSDGTPITPGYYDFDENGKMVFNGPIGDYFYKDGAILKAYQLVKYKGDFYFINDGNKLTKNKRIYLSQKFVEGTTLAVGYYEFGADGKMAKLNGPVGDYFYKDGAMLKAYQLVEFEGNYYFINDSNKLAKNTTVYLSQRFLEGTDLEVGYYKFDANGKMIIE